MRLPHSNDVHLTYCTNIHPGETWSEIRQNLEHCVLAVKNRVAPGKPFGIGLRLSSVAADELSSSHKLEEFQQFLSSHDLYVFTINGFPYGTFHGDRVKENVYLPDWRDKERLRYTIVLADLLAALLPSDANLYGSVSTVPGAFKPEIRAPVDVERIASFLVDAAIHLVQLKANTGKTVTLALEPEPCCFLETVDETITFFHRYLFSPSSIERLAAHTGMSRTHAEAAMRCHLGVCLDLCHAAVEYESPHGCVLALQNAGIQIFKMQISAGLRVPSVTPEKAECLRQFDDGTYLHQVVERRGAEIIRYTDLDMGFVSLPERNEDCEWRIHLHVPIFATDLGGCETTQEFIRQVLAQHRKHVVSAHLEVETYTWGVLPEAYHDGDIVHGICRELEWVHHQLHA